MNRIAITLATGFLVAAGAAQAQYGPPPAGRPAYGPYRGGYDAGAFWRGAPDSPWERIRFLQDRIDHGVADGSLDRREAARASRELDGVRQYIRREHWEDAGRLTPDQRARVQQRLDAVSRNIRWMRHYGW
jgi:hypothetical protein